MAHLGTSIPPRPGPGRRLLDALYGLMLWLSAACLVAIAILVGAQVAGRMLDAVLKALGLAQSGFVILSLAEMAGYLLAAASFLGLAGTLKAGVHIRVAMFVARLPARARQVVETAGLLFGAAGSLYATLAIGRLAWDSYQFNEISPGLIPVPLVLPQAAMALGAACLVIAFTDEAIITLRQGRPSFGAAEDAITLGQEG